MTKEPYNEGSEYYYNLYVNVYDCKNGKFEKIDKVSPLKFRTPYYKTEGVNKTLKAEIEFKVDYNLNIFTYDTLKYELFIYDRALNKSNIIESDTVFLNKEKQKTAIPEIK